MNSHNTTRRAAAVRKWTTVGSFRRLAPGQQFVLNLGLRRDYYGVAQVSADGCPSGARQLGNPTDLRKMDFGPKRSTASYEADGNNIGPRVASRDAGGE